MNSTKEPVRVVGKAKSSPLAAVKPNSWNMNEMNPFMRDSLKRGLLEDGWVASEALLIWGTDAKGKERNIIIDGEHRWRAATELGFKTGPMVFLENLPEAKAKALTIKMNHKRGVSDETKLAILVKELQGENIQIEDYALSLGLEQSHMMQLLAEEAIVIPEQSITVETASNMGQVDMPSGKQTHVKMVQLFFDDATHREFMLMVSERADRTKEKNVTEVVLGAMRDSRTSS